MNQTRSVRHSIAETFSQLKAKKQIGLVAFVPAGYPDLATTASVLPALEKAGANLIEIGFPFSDPIADGPIIQEAFVDALARKVKIADVFATVAATRAKLTVPLVAMLSYSIVFRYGLEKFLADAKSAGFDGLIIPDLPPPEGQRVCGIIRASGLDIILLIAPTTTAARREEITRLSSGFVYYLSVSGITGERDQLPTDLADNLNVIKAITALPVCVGFGISQPHHVAQLAPIAAGAIVGTAIVRRMKHHAAEGPQAIADAVGAYVRDLMAQVR